MTWQPKTYAEGLRMAWDEDDDGIDHCLSYIEPHLPETGVVLDVGCGVGRLTKPLADRHPNLHFVGTDSSLDMLDLARDHANAPNIKYEAWWVPADTAMAYSVVTFQHISDEDVRWYLYAVAHKASAPFVFQFVEGDEREPLSMQRSAEDVMDWCVAVGYDVIGQKDSRFPNWWWYSCTLNA